MMNKMNKAIYQLYWDAFIWKRFCSVPGFDMKDEEEKLFLEIVQYYYTDKINTPTYL